MVAAWRALRIEELISLKSRDVLRAARMMLGADPPTPSPGSFRYGGMLDTSGLERFVLRVIPWRGIDRSLRERHLHAISVSATHVGTGHTVVFLSSCDPVPREWSRDPFVRHRAARIGPRHVLASAAIPLLFPTVKIGDEFFTDGGLRQNTPMSPAIRLGADRLLLVSLRHVKKPPAAGPKEPEPTPKPLFLAGKALNALLLDHTEYDLQRMQRINLILEAGHASFGDKFETMMNHELVRLRGAPLRRIQAVHIRPSEDIGEIAANFVETGRVRTHGIIARKLLDRLAGRGGAAHESDLLSYILFDGGFAAELIDLGRRDAAKKEDELAALFDTSAELRRAEPALESS